MGPLQVLSRSSYWCSLSTPPLLLTHSPKMWLGETFQYTDHLRLTNRHPNPLHCHFYLISSSLHQNLGTSVASFVLRRLPSWTLSTRTRGKKNHPWKIQCHQVGLWAVVPSHKDDQTLWLLLQNTFNVCPVILVFMFILPLAVCLCFSLKPGDWFSVYF